MKDQMTINPEFERAVEEMDKENSPLVLEHQTGCTEINSTDSIPHSIGLDSFIGSVQSFRLYLNAMRTLLTAGVIAP